LAPLFKIPGGRGIARGQIRRMLLSRSGDPSWLTDKVLDSYAGASLRDIDGTVRVLKAMAQAREPVSLAEHLSDICVPVWLLVGAATREGGLPAEETTLLASRLPAFRVDSIRGSGPLVHEERPASVIAAVVGLAAQTQ